MRPILGGDALLVTGCGRIAPPEIDARLAGRLSPHQARRLDRLSQMLLVAALDALDPAGPAAGDAEATAIVIGTGLGCLGKTDDFIGGVARAGAAHADALTFPDSVDNAPAAHLAIACGIRGPAITVSQREISGEMAVLTAAMLLRSGLVNRAIVAAGETTSPRWREAYARLAPRREPGEAAAAIVLERPDFAADRGRWPRALLYAEAQACGPVPGGRLRAAPTTLRHLAEEEAVRTRRITEEINEYAPGLEDPLPALQPAVPGPYIMADGILRAIDAIERMAAGDRRPRLVSRSARGGVAAALLLGPAVAETCA